MSRIVSILAGLLLALASVASAQAPPPKKLAIVVDDKPATFLVETDGKGGAKAVPLAGVVMLSPGGDNPEPEPPPPPGSLSTKVTAATSAAFARGGTVTAATGLSEAFSAIASAVESDKLKPADVFGEAGALKKATDAVLNITKDGPAWDQWRRDVAAAMGERLPMGTASPKLDVAKALRDAEDGIKRAVNSRQEELLARAMAGDDAALLDGLDIKKLLEILRAIIELINSFSK